MAEVWAPIEEWLKEDPTIRAWLESDNQETLIQQISTQDLTVWAVILTYSGSDVKIIITRVIINHRAWMTANADSDVIFKLSVNNVTEPKKI